MGREEEEEAMKRSWEEKNSREVSQGPLARLAR